MNFRILLCAAVVFPFAVGTASAATRLSDTQMDVVTAGQSVLPPIIGIDCPGCAIASSASNSQNGITTSSSSSGTTVGGTPGGGSGNPGSGGNSGNGGSTGPSGPGVLTGSVQIPPAIAATLQQAVIATGP